MQQLIQLLIGVFILTIGFPLGDFLARVTTEELKKGQRWFRAIIILSLIGCVDGLIIGNDIFFFSFAFIVIITSRSLGNRKRVKQKRKI